MATPELLMQSSARTAKICYPVRSKTLILHPEQGGKLLIPTQHKIHAHMLQWTSLQNFTLHWALPLDVKLHLSTHLTIELPVSVHRESQHLDCSSVNPATRDKLLLLLVLLLFQKQLHIGNKHRPRQITTAFIRNVPYRYHMQTWLLLHSSSVHNAAHLSLVQFIQRFQTSDRRLEPGSWRFSELPGGSVITACAPGGVVHGPGVLALCGGVAPAQGRWMVRLQHELPSCSTSNRKRASGAHTCHTA
jgi:hypothetical protein